MAELLWIESLIFLSIRQNYGYYMGGFHKDLWEIIHYTEIFKKLKNMDDQIKKARRILEFRPVCKPL